MTFSRGALLLTATLTAGLPAMAAAQTPSLPTRDELQRQQPTPSPRDTTPRISVQDGIERAPCPLAAPRFADVMITMAEARFDGLQVVSSDALRSTWAEFAGRSVPIATVCEIRDRAATILRREGYIAAVQVPPQRIEEGGIVRFDVLMARLVRIQVRGDAGRAEGIIARQLAKLQEQPVFNTFEAERYLLLVDDIPGYDARLTLKPAGTGPGEVIGEVTVKYTPVEVEANVQNFGASAVGRLGGMVRARLNGLTGLGDMTTLAYFNTFDWREQHVLQASHSFRLGEEGLTLGGDLTYAFTRPGVGGGDPFRTRTLIATLRAAYPLKRSLGENLVLGGGLDLANQRARFAQDTVDVALNHDKLRVLFARLDYDRIDPDSLGSIRGYSASEPRWRFGGSLELRHGVSVFGGSEACADALCTGRTPLSRPRGDPTAFVVRASAHGEWRPSPAFTLALSPRAQYAPDPLLAFEEFSTGNYTIGRGYDAGTLVGDSGVGVQAEVRVGSLVPRRVGGWALQPFAFLDAARIWNQDKGSLYPRDPQSLYSAGGGVRARWGDRARIDAFMAAPLQTVHLFDLSNPGTERRVKGDVRFLASLTVNLFPWTR